MAKISPQLDFTSEQFDPSLALAAENLYLPFPKAKIYDNLADWYSHAFNKKKNDSLSNQESKTASKNSCYVLKRNYEWYYETLGLDLPQDFDIQSRYKKFTKRKRSANGKYQIDKKVVVKEMPSEMLQPMRSSKILIKRSDGSLKDFILVCTDNVVHTDSSSVENIAKFENSNVKTANSFFEVNSQPCNKKAKIAGDSIGESANCLKTETSQNIVSPIKECYSSSNKNDCLSSTNDCTSKSDIEPKSDVSDNLNHKASENNCSLSLSQLKSCKESIDVRKQINHQKYRKCVEDDSKSDVLLSTEEESVSALKKSSSETSNFINSETRINLFDNDKTINIQSAVDSENSNLYDSPAHVTAEASDKTSSLKHKKIYSIPPKPYSLNSNDSVLPIALKNEKRKRINKSKFEKTSENLSPNFEGIDIENKISASGKIEEFSDNTLTCKNEISDFKLNKCKSSNKVFKMKKILSSNKKLFNKKEGKNCKSEFIAKRVTRNRNNGIVNNTLDVSSTSQACVNLNKIPNSKKISKQARQPEKLVDIAPSFIDKSPHIKKRVHCRNNQSSSKSLNNESIRRLTNSNTLITYSSCITNKIPELEKSEDLNLEECSTSILNSGAPKKSFCKGDKIIKIKSANKSINVLNKSENSNSLNGSARKSYDAPKKSNKVSSSEKNNNLQDKDAQNLVVGIDTLCNLKVEDICKKNFSADEVLSSSTTEAKNSAFIVSEKSESSVGKASNLEFRKCNSLSPKKKLNNIPSIISESEHDKENEQHSLESINCSNPEDKLKSKNYIPESERLLSPLKLLNTIPGVESKKCDNHPRESLIDCNNNKSSIVKSPYRKGNNTKELALLELARRARKRLHIQQ